MVGEVVGKEWAVGRWALRGGDGGGRMLRDGLALRVMCGAD